MKSILNHIVILLFCLLPIVVQSQQTTEYKWFDPVGDNRIQFNGQGWAHTELESPYDRLPAKAKETVREAVWDLSRQAAGIYLSFASDATGIKVRYQAGSRYQMPHMPATGVSGLDLYVLSPETGEWLWCRGRYSFEDTITYSYSDLNTRHPHPDKSYQYRLYLPLYNHVKWLEIGLPSTSTLSPPEVNKTKPIVVYGTSIAQGACASRPAMAWSTIVQRNLNAPVINLAFSGNGRLEQELIELINEIDARLYILDCLPNLTSQEQYPDEELRKRIRESVQSLRNSHPNTPILLTAHAGNSNDRVSADSYQSVARVNSIQKEMYETLKKEGVDHLYNLSRESINLCMDCTVDSSHPTDLGMAHYGDAYLKKIREIFAMEP